MEIHFHKYHGTGNDFILIDNREKNIVLAAEQIKLLCDRRFGIGADGLMLMNDAIEYDFHMLYYNSDGNESTMCGNGGRCITAFAKKLGIITNKASFTAIDGVHRAEILPGASINLYMQNVKEIFYADDCAILNTGSPHYIKWVNDVQSVNVFSEGREIRNSKKFQPKGINVNFVQKLPDGLWVRTYERGVEDETYSCGTGVVAAAIAASGDAVGSFKTKIYTPGGELEVSFQKKNAATAEDILLMGPAVFVFEGELIL